MPEFRYLILVWALLLVPAVAQGKEERAALDPCALITRSEIEALQGEEVVSTKRSTPKRSGLAVSQCFYTAATFAKSVSLEITRRDPDGAAGRSPRDEWIRLFHRDAQKSEPTDKDEKGKGQPRPVAGVGDESFWSRDSVAGALYVLKGNAYFRISIGGGENRVTGWRSPKNWPARRSGVFSPDASRL